MISILIVYFYIQDYSLNTDYLTGVNNRRQLDNYLRKKIQNGELDHLLRSYKSGYSAGSALDKMLAEQYVHLSDSRRRADRVIWAGLGRIPDPKTDVPAIVVEFVSNRQRDRVRDYEEKRRQYLAIGVQEYWIIDRFQRIMTVCRGRPGEPAEQIIKENEIYRTTLLTGFELPLARLLKVANDWAGPVRARQNRRSTRGSTPPVTNAMLGRVPHDSAGVPPDWVPGRYAI